MVKIVSLSDEVISLLDRVRVESPGTPENPISYSKAIIKIVKEPGKNLKAPKHI